MLKINLEVQIDHVNYHVHDGRMINYRDFVQIEGETNTPQLAAEMALKLAFSYYWNAAARISADGP